MNSLQVFVNASTTTLSTPLDRFLVGVESSSVLILFFRGVSGATNLKYPLNIFEKF